jgi:hypothetical protein
MCPVLQVVYDTQLGGMDEEAGQEALLARLAERDPLLGRSPPSVQARGAVKLLPLRLLKMHKSCQLHTLAMQRRWPCLTTGGTLELV